MNKLSDWKWAIDYSKSVGQEDEKLAPIFFSSRAKAQEWNRSMYPNGRVLAVVIREKRK